MRYELYFPTPIWWEDTDDIAIEPILKLCYDLRKDDTVGRTLSNQGGWQSQDFESDRHPELADLVKKILNQAENCIRDYGYDEDECMLAMGNMWANINGENHTNSVHIHDNAFLSGAFYVKAEPGQGPINFYKSYSQDYIVASQARVKHYTPISASAMSFHPKVGKLIMFPGYLPHGVERNGTNSDRISISFNVKLMRKIDGLYWSKNFK
jgi:uncharacterized protein (TIGR02466 family)